MSDTDNVTLEKTIATELSAGKLAADGRDPVDRRQAAVVAIGRRAIAPPNLSVLIWDAAALAAETVAAESYGVAELKDGNDSRMKFRFGTTGNTGAERKHMLDREATSSFSAYAISTAHPVIVADLSGEKRFTDVFLTKQGVVSGIVCPLANVERPYGSIGVYSTKRREFPKEDVLLVESMAHVITTAIARQSAEQVVGEQRKFSMAMLETMDAPVIVLTPQGRIVRMNRACQETTGFAPHEIKDRALWSALLIPEDVGEVKAAIDRLIEGQTPVRFESFILTKSGERRRISWSFTTLQREDGSIESLLGTGVDITRECAFQEQLEQAEAAADEARRSLEELKTKIDVGQKPVPGRSGAKTDAQSDRRARVRKSYPYVQLIAPFRNRRLPGPSEFEEIRCRDISARGFSYVQKDVPDYEKVVVAFGIAPSLMYVIAEIRHVTPTTLKGRSMHQIGCEYTARAPY